MADFSLPQFNLDAPEFVIQNVSEDEPEQEENLPVKEPVLPAENNENDALNKKNIEETTKVTKKISSSLKVTEIKNPPVEFDKNRKESVSITFIGHVDAGKSTLSGHVMLLTGNVDQRLLEKYKAEAAERKMDSWYLSYFMDTTEEERARGKTVSCGHGLFETEKRFYYLIDAPGHQKYITEMISGSSYAEVAIMVISARTGEFEAGFVKNGQTKEHTLLVRTSGVTKMIVFVNKLELSDWSKERFDEIVSKYTPFLKRLMFDVKKDIFFIPGSGYSGANIQKNEGVCPWYTGPSLIEKLDSIVLDEKQVDSPLRLIIGDKIKDFNTTIHSGKILAGSVAPGHILRCMPQEITVVIENIRLETDDSTEPIPKGKGSTAFAGENITFTLSLHSSSSNFHNLDSINTGNILCSPDSPINRCKQIYVELSLLSGDLMLPGFKCIMHMLSETREVTFDKVLKFIDKKTKQKVIADRTFIKPNDKAIARFSFDEEIVCEEHSSFPMLSRFNLRKNEDTIAIGKVVLIPKKEKAKNEMNG